LSKNAEQRIALALAIAYDYGQVDGDHHKAWVIDQMVRALTDCPSEVKYGTDSQGYKYSYSVQGESEEYKHWVKTHNNGEDGPDTYSWDEGITP